MVKKHNDVAWSPDKAVYFGARDILQNTARNAIFDPKCIPSHSGGKVT